MSRQYDEYLTRHRNGVAEAFQWILDNFPGMIDNDIQIKAQENIMHHDASKNDIEEYDAYDKYFYGSNSSFAVLDAFNRAWLHHIHHNPHHWQHWILFEDDPIRREHYKCLEMPEEYVIEMICDWWSFSFAKGDLEEIFAWYDKHKATIKLHHASKRLVERYLAMIKQKLEELKEKE